MVVRHPDLCSTSPSFGIPSPLPRDKLCLANMSSELYVRWNYCYVIWNKHVRWSRWPLQMSRTVLVWK